MIIILNQSGSISFEATTDLVTRISISVALLGYVFSMVYSLIDHNGEPVAIINKSGNKIQEHLGALTGHDELFPVNLLNQTLNETEFKRNLNIT